MGAISTINMVSESSFTSMDANARSSINTIDGHTISNDSISLSSGSIYFDIYGDPLVDDWVIVTSSGSWTASIISDDSNMIDSFTSSGVNQDLLYVAVSQNTTIQDCHSATIRVTRGTVYEDLTIYQDGTVLTCS